MHIHIYIRAAAISFLFALCSLWANAQRETPKAAELNPSGSSSYSSSTKSGKGTPAKINDTYGIWTDFNLRTKSDADALKARIGSSLFNEIADNCNETTDWPGAIKSYEERNKVRDQMEKYVAYQIAEIDDKWILKIPASENSFLPYGVRPDHDIYFVIGKTYVTLTGAPTSPVAGSSSYSSSSSSSSSAYKPVSTLKGPKAKIKDSFGIWTDFDLRSKSDANQVKRLLGEALFEDVANNCNEKLNWPSGISSYEQREKVRPEMKNYVAYQIGESDDKWILRIPASENSFQPYNMRPSRDIYFMMRKTDVELSGSPINTLSSSSSSSSGSSSSGSSYSSSSGSNYSSSKGTPAKINATGGMYSTYNLNTDDKASYLKGYLGYSLFDEVAEYCKEANWPSGIADLSARDKVRSQMNDYKAYKIAEFDGKYILRIPASENKFMPYNMQPSRDIFFIINSSDVTLNKSSSGSSSSSGNSSGSSSSYSSGSSSYTSNPVGFEAQLNALLEGYPSRWENLKGDMIPKDPNGIMQSDEWNSKVKLEGSETTIIRKGSFGTTTALQADYGEYATKSEATARFKWLVGKVAASKFKCCTFVQNDETPGDAITMQSWLPFDLSGKMGSGYDGIVLEARWVKTFAFDKKTLDVSDRWSVSLSIYKLK